MLKMVTLFEKDGLFVCVKTVIVTIPLLVKNIFQMTTIKTTIDKLSIINNSHVT